MRDGYLTDEELNSLISEIEANDMVTAPPEILEEILCKLEDPVINSKVIALQSYRQYCRRVVITVAAAVILLFTIPFIKIRYPEEIPTKEMVMQEYKVKTKEEVLNENEISLKDRLKNFGGLYGTEKEE